MLRLLRVSSSPLRSLCALLAGLALAAATPAASAPPAAGPAGKILVEICEQGIPTDNSWPTAPQVTEHYEEDLFGLFELPQKYISTGVRADRHFPTLVRASATVVLPPGKHQLLLRARGATRLFVDGRVVATTPFDQPRQFAVGNAGELPVEEQNTFFDIGPGFRYAPPGNRDATAELEVPASGTPAPLRIVLETLVGGRLPPKHQVPFRPELGETVVAVRLAGTRDWQLLSPGERRVRYTDADWAAYEAERRARLTAMNTAARAARRAEHAA